MQVTRYDIERGGASPRPKVTYHHSMTARDEPLPAVPSPLAAALDRVGDRWSLQVVEADRKSVV